MNTQGTVQVKFTGSPDEIAQWRADFQASPDQVTIASLTQEKDPTALHFGLIEAAALATIINLSFFTLQLAVKIHDRLAAAKAAREAKARVLVVETPLGKAVFTSTDNLSEQQINDKLKALVKAHE